MEYVTDEQNGDPTISTDVKPAVEEDKWLCCDICDSWRLLPSDSTALNSSSLPLQENESWTCVTGCALFDSTGDITTKGIWDCGSPEGTEIKLAYVKKEKTVFMEDREDEDGNVVTVVADMPKKVKIQPISTGDRTETINRVKNTYSQSPSTPSTFQRFTKSNPFTPSSVDYTSPFVITVPPPGLSVPSHWYGDFDTSINSIINIIGPSYPINVLDSLDQKEKPVSLGPWLDLVREDKLTRAENLISLEFTDLKLVEYVKPPQFVKDICWVTNHWPPNTPNKPQVGNYCLISSPGCWTDFHSDFGGSTVWYHVVCGIKIFYLLEPTDFNRMKYEEWLCDPSQASIFFPDIGRNVKIINVKAGETLCIPSGWIHGVYTPVKSLAFGGNLLHDMGVEMQIEINSLETRVNVVEKFKFPEFVQVCYYRGAGMVREMREGRGGEELRKRAGKLAEALKGWNGGEVGVKAHDAARVCNSRNVKEMVEELMARARGEDWNGGGGWLPLPKKVKAQDLGKFNNPNPEFQKALENFKQTQKALEEQTKKLEATKRALQAQERMKEGVAAKAPTATGVVVAATTTAVTTKLPPPPPAAVQQPPPPAPKPAAPKPAAVQQVVKLASSKGRYKHLDEVEIDASDDDFELSDSDFEEEEEEDRIFLEEGKKRLWEEEEEDDIVTAKPQPKKKKKAAQKKTGGTGVMGIGKAPPNLALRVAQQKKAAASKSDFFRKL
ncbi:hypothetical protein TrST_g5711 [Triparma strigata]|uniref:JmjC domain-containing protein n=1 Tax=Triparma strigata TaxID=1606541 RepID=A0A9W7AYY9_9STRA|nr:hypothetical protein TrST_g5711 [Triparma strigata]